MLNRRVIMQNVRLRKKSERPKWPYVHGVKDYRKILNFQVDKGWIDKTPICTAKKGNVGRHKCEQARSERTEFVRRSNMILSSGSGYWVIRRWLRTWLSAKQRNGVLQPKQLKTCHLSAIFCGTLCFLPQVFLSPDSKHLPSGLCQPA